jgi:dihydrofolate synthase/folylpolyglutamate synthase
VNAVEVFEDWLDGYLNFERTPKKDIFWLDTIDYLCKRFDNPQDCAPCFHVAGSKGKGSVSRMISCILEQAGYSVGIYSSPHILDFRERISKPNSFFDEAIYEETVRDQVAWLKKEGKLNIA